MVLKYGFLNYDEPKSSTEEAPKATAAPVAAASAAAPAFAAPPSALPIPLPPFSAESFAFPKPCSYSLTSPFKKIKVREGIWN